MSAAYVSFLDTLPSATFDLVLDDGWARGKVATDSLRLLKPGGLLILDDHSVEKIRDSEDQYLAVFNKRVANWRAVTWHDGVQFTAGFFKPLEGG